MKKITLKQVIEQDKLSGFIKQNKDLVGDKDAFFELLTKASQPAYPSNDEKAESQTVKPPKTGPPFKL